MAELAIRIAAVVLGIGYAGVVPIRAYVATIMPLLRRDYIASIPICLMVSGNQWWLLATGPANNARAIFAQTAYALALVFVYTRPPIVTIREHRRLFELSGRA